MFGQPDNVINAYWHQRFQQEAHGWKFSAADPCDQRLLASKVSTGSICASSLA